MNSDIEDKKHERVIAGPGEKYRTGGSYIYVMFEGVSQVLNFDYDS